MADPFGSTATPPTPAKCPACELPSERILWTEAGHIGKACSCGNVFVDPSPALSDEELSYDGHFRTYYSRPAGVRLSFIERFRPRGKLLEVGCGCGELLRLARDRGFSVAGMEPNAVCADYVRRLGIDVECEFIERSPPRMAFDVVYHVDLLSHFPDPVAALNAMCARLTPKGILCFEVGILGGIAPTWYRYLGGVGFPQHRFLYSELGLRRLLSRAGLEVVNLRTFGLAASLLLSGVRHLYGNGVRERIHRRHALGRYRPLAPRLPPEPDALVSAYDYVTYLLRYGIGRGVPRVGPLTAFVAAQPRSG